MSRSGGWVVLWAVMTPLSGVAATPAAIDVLRPAVTPHSPEGQPGAGAAHGSEVWRRGLAEGASAGLILLSLGLAGATLRSWSRRPKPEAEA